MSVAGSVRDGDVAGAVRSLPLLPVPARVLATRAEYAGTGTLTLDAPGIDPAPGQFVMVGRPGYGEVPISVSGADGEGRIDLTVAAVGAATHAIVETEAGGVLGMRGPYGTAWPLDAVGGDLLIMAGGLGLAPLRMAFLAARRAARERGAGRVILLYGTREPGRIVFDREILRWIAEAGAEVHVTVDAADVAWKGNVGLITTLLERKTIDPSCTTAFVCGPEVMMRFSARALEDRGVARSAIFVSVERHMACATGVCGRCQLGPFIVCRDGAVLPWDRVARALSIAEL